MSYGIQFLFEINLGNQINQFDVLKLLHVISILGNNFYVVVLTIVYVRYTRATSVGFITMAGLIRVPLCTLQPANNTCRSVHSAVH